MQKIKKNKGLFFSFNFILCFLYVISCRTSPPPRESIIELIRTGKIDELKERFNEDSINMKDEDGNSLLHISVNNNDVVITKFLLSMGADIESQDALGRTPLLSGLNYQSYDACRVLVDENASVFSSDAEGVTPFGYAQSSGLTKIILTPKTIFQKDSKENTMLHYAVINLKPLLAEHILEIGKPLTNKNKDGLTPLALAYRNTSSEAAAEIASLLIVNGSELLGGNFIEFETASLARNYGMRFGSGETLLHIFARKGYTGFIKFLLNQKIPIDIKNMASSTALHEAVRNGNVDTAILLLDSGADSNVRDASGNTALHLVMPEHSRSKLFSKLLEAGAKPDIKDNYGETPLHIAARIKMDENIIVQLINAGADVNERNKKGQSPLLLAIERNQLEQIDTLIKYGADIYAEDTYGETALTRAIDNGITMVNHVITEKNSSYRDSNGYSPLHIAVSKKADVSIIYRLLEKKCPVNTRDKLGNTPLHIAVSNNYREAGEILLANNADIFYSNVNGQSPIKLAMELTDGRESWMINSHTISAKDRAGNTLLHLAAEWKFVPMILYLLDKGADINAKNTNNETPLFSAVKSDCTEAIHTLLGAGGGIEANINARDFLGNSVLHAAIKWSAYDSAKLLLSMTSDGFTSLIHSKNFAGKTVLHEAAKQGNLKFLTIFINARADVNASDEIGCSPLTEAVLTDKYEAVDFLLNNGASPTTQDMHGRTPLYEAVSIGSINTIVRIRKSGGNPLARTSNGKTPFLLALEKDESIINAVLGNDKFLADSDGNTPLHIAVNENASSSVIKMLIAKNYPVDKRNRNGTTALLSAVQNNQKENVLLLLTAGADPFIVNNNGVCAIGEIFQNHFDFVQLAAEFALGRSDGMGDGLLHYAAKYANPETVETLLNMAGVDVSAKNTAGETAYDVAMRWRRNKIADLLQSKK